jgi:small subunit ribosomal protein S17
MADEKNETTEETAEPTETPEPVEEVTPEAPAADAATPEPATDEPSPEPTSDAPEAKTEGVAPSTQAQQSGPKKKKKRLPRALRPKRTRPQREKSAERKPITRLPKPENERGRTQERRGVVVSDKGDKTIVVRVDTIKAHRRYKKVVRQSVKFHAHDERNEAKTGDVVRIVETRPLSKTKRWRLAEIVEVAK